MEVYQPLAPDQPKDAPPQPLCMCCGGPVAFNGVSQVPYCRRCDTRLTCTRVELQYIPSGTPRNLADLVCSADCLTYLDCRRRGGLRRVVQERDRGVCELCALDCERLVEEIAVRACVRARCFVLRIAPQPLKHIHTRTPTTR